MGLNLYAKIEQYLDFDEEVSKLHSEFLSIIFDKKLDNILDIGCGQGSFVKNLNDNSIDAFGIDLSDEQIRIAKKNGVKNVSCTPLNKVEKKYSCATAIFDVINYIPKDHIKIFFDEVSLVLEKDGYFIFDINSLFGFEEVAQGTLSIDLDDKFIVIDAFFEDEELNTNITLFTQNKNKMFEKESDSITQYYYETLKLKELLKNSGFKVENIINFHLHDEQQSDKSVFICKKI